MNQHQILRSTVVVSVGTGFSRLLGLVREVLMAVFFGTTLFQSAFTVAFTVPNLFRRLFGEGALSAAFVPVFTENIEKEDIESTNRLASGIMTMLGTILLMIVLVGILLTSAAMKFLPLSEKAAVILPLLQIMLPYLFFICMVALCMAILNSFHHFTVPAITPAVLNVVWIATLIWICPRLGHTPAERIYGVAWGILGAGAIQLIIQIPVLLRFGLRPNISFVWQDEKIRRILLLMGPAAVGMGVFQINTMVDRLLALAAADWAPAALRFSERLLYLPLGLFATALGTVLLPTFSRQAAQSKPEAMKRTLSLSLRALMMVMIPAAVGLLVLAGPVVQSIFEWPHGTFNADSTTQTARALMFYAPGLIVFSLYKVLVPLFYALKDTRTPVRIGLWTVFLNLTLNIIFILTWPYEFKHAGLAFATVLASAVNAAILARILHQRIGSPGWGAIISTAARSLVASLLMGVAVFMSHKLLAGLVIGASLHVKSGQLVALAGSMLIGLIVYSVLIVLLCRKDLREIRRDRKQDDLI